MTQVAAHSTLPNPSVPERITVLIPTRERADTLEYALSTCVNQTDDNLRILVSDNASTDNTKAVVEKFRQKDRRVEYINPGKRLGMSEHWEFALDHVDEGFVTIIGDDDALFPDAMPAIRSTLKAVPGTQAISWPYSFYGYPALPTPSRNHLGIAFGERDGERKSWEWIGKLTAFEVSYYELPMIYHGLVHVQLLEEIRARSGRLILSSVPDVYLAIAVAAVTENYYRLSRSMTLTGTSRHSYGSAALTQGDNSPIVQSFWKESSLARHPKVPRLQLVPVIVLECILCAQEAGFLPDTLPVAYEQCVSRAFIELCGADHSENVFRDFFDRLEELCRRIGQTEHLERLKKYSPIERKALEDRLAATPWFTHHQIVANLSNTSVKDVAGAVALAGLISRDEVLRQACERMSGEVREVRMAFSNRESQLNELTILARGLQEKLDKSRIEFVDRVAILAQELAQLDAESTARLQQVEELTEMLSTSEKDRADRLSQIRELNALARRQQEELDLRNREFTDRIAALGREIEELNIKSKSRLEQIEKLTEMVRRSERGHLEGSAHSTV